jgi:16S rRNA (cytosine967-C5)-methyltransferase
MTVNIRALAAQCTFAVVEQGRSLTEELPKQQLKADAKDKGLLQELCYGVLRYLPELEHDVRQLMDKPLTGKQRLFHFLILVGIYQFKYTRIPDHAAVGETVAAAPILKNKRLKGLINGVLRNFQRQQQEQTTNTPNKPLPDAIKYNHPSWFIKKVQHAYPQHWQNILLANQQKPPMWLRVNQQHHSVDEYKVLLAQADIKVELVDEFSGAIQLSSAQDVNSLPGFEQGWVSIQDGAAQQAANLLNSQKNDNVLDCCAAPGGKTCHILERTANITMTAIDLMPQRLERVNENLARLNLTAKVIAGDAANPQDWWDKKQFDRILLDAPCSGTGVIRRHPDIKWLRKANDINVLTQLQQQIITNIWPLLKVGGTLIYATCSILPEENSEQIATFLANTTDAELQPISFTNKNISDIGWQILPDQQGMDGFYYAKIKKISL